jgi:DNA polymerase III subunit delta'
LLHGDSDGSISIDTVRDVQHFLSRKAASTAITNRIALIVHAERLTPEAQNAFLKTLEEPPAGSVLILTADDKQSLLPTILSRVQSLEVITPDEASLREHFESAGHSQTAIDRSLLMSGGLPGLMTAILSGEKDHPLVTAADRARNILRLDTFGRLAVVDGLSKQREQCLDMLFILQQMATLSLRSPSKSPNVYKQWQTVLKQAYETELVLRAGAQPKLALTNLMLSL